MKFKNTKKAGDYALAKAIDYFSEKGYTVSIPLTDSQDYDLVVDINNKLERIQVKYSGTGTVGLRLLGGNSKRNFVHKANKDFIYDYLFVYFDNKRFLIPKDMFNNNKSGLSFKSGKWNEFLV